MVRLTELRQEAGLDPAGLAAAAGVPEAMVRAIESGEANRLDHKTVQAISRALRVHPSTIDEFRPALGIDALGETGAGEDAESGARKP